MTWLLLKDGDGVVHLEREPWWPWCMYSRGDPLNRSADEEYFRRCELVEEHVTCIWCAARRQRS